jgi:hypothetical protein
MPSSGMLRRVALVITDVSVDVSASFIRVTRIGETSALTTTTWRNIPEDDILHSYCRDNLKSYIALTGWALQRRRDVFLVRYGLHTVPNSFVPSAVLHTVAGPYKAVR